MAISADPLEVQGKANIDSMFWATGDGVPWHGLGTEVPDALTAADALSASGQDWTVSVESLVTASGIPVIDGRRCKAIVRDDRQAVLGIVGRRYKPIQNKEAFDFLDSLAADQTIRYHTAGVLGAGERVWILAQLKGDITIPKTDDTIKRFLLFSNSHDGTSAARVFWTPIRVVCQNTLNQAVRGAKGEGVVIRHTGNLESKVAEAQRVLGLAVKAYDDIKGMILASAKVKLSDTQRKAYFNSLFGPKPGRANDEDGESADEVSTRTQKTLDRLEELAHTGRGNDVKAVRGSLWTAYNAVTEFIDHERGTRVSKGSDGNLIGDERSQRLNSIWFGSGARTKEQAWELATAAVKDIAVLN